MKIRLLLLLLLSALSLHGQSVPAAGTIGILPGPGGIGISCNAVTAATSINPGTAGGCAAFFLGNNSLYTWSVSTTGSPASISVNLMASLDGTTWTQVDTTTATTPRTVGPFAYRFLGCVPATLSGGSSPTLTCQLSGVSNPLAANQLTLGANGGSAGQVVLAGSTSGTATITAPAVAGTATNPVTVSNTVQLPSGTVYQFNADTGISRTAAGVLAAGNATAADESGLLRWNTCKLSADVTLPVNTATTVCTWNLPAVAKTWGWHCDLPWAITAGSGTNTISIGVNASQTPTTGTTATAVIWSAAATSVTGSAAAIAASGAINVLTSGTITPGASFWTSHTSGTLAASASAGTFSITMTAAGTTATAAAKSGGSCILF